MQLRVLLAAFVAPLIAADQPGLSQSKIDQIQQAVSREMSRQTIPGVSVAVGYGGQTLWSEGLGMADLENLVPMTRQTEIRLGSISKTITAIAVLQLYERGRIELDAPIQQYLPSFPRKPWPITIRQLLCHQSGIRHYRDNEASSTRHYTNRIDPLKIFEDDPLLFEPGTKYSYTTYGYNLLGAAVEAAARMPFPDYVRTNIFRPAGMEHITVDDSYAIIPHRARGYTLLAGMLQNCGLADTSNKIPAGGMISPSEDLVRLAMALDGGKLLKPSTVQLMSTPQRLKSGFPTTYGLGVFIYQIDGHHAIGHSGSQQGTSTQFLLFPAENVALAVMCNRDGADTRAIVNEIARIALQ
jgi:CubicO group peptidase (beta-lactamase class C family)